MNDLCLCRGYSCSSRVTINTYTIKYDQDFLVTMAQTCGDPKEVVWTSQLSMTGVIMKTDLKVDVNYDR
jgi:hypothetical protein